MSELEIVYIGSLCVILALVVFVVWLLERDKNSRIKEAYQAIPPEVMTIAQAAMTQAYRVAEVAVARTPTTVDDSLLKEIGVVTGLVDSVASDAPNLSEAKTPNDNPLDGANEPTTPN